MTNEKRRPMNEGERKAHEAIQRLAEVRADEDFRARLKDRFLAAAAEERVRPRSPRRRSEPRRQPRHSRRRWIFGLASAAVAAALVIAFLIWNRGPRWSVTSASGDGVLRIGARAIPLDRLEDVELEPGTMMKTEGDAEIVLRAGDQMVFVLTPDSGATLPETFGRWIGNEATIAVSHGQVRVMTLPGFEDHLLMLETEETMMEVVGTTLAVIRNDVGTCLCVYEGKVQMKDRMGGSRGETESVPRRMRRVVYRDPGRPAVMEPLEPMEEAKLQMLHDAFEDR